MRLAVRWIVFSIIAIVLSAAMVYAEDFSAEMVSSSRQGSFTAKLYVSGDKTRVEMPEATTITRVDKKVVWMLMPGGNMYIEQPIDMRTVVSTRKNVEGEVERTAEGSETIDGRGTTKYRVTFEANGKRESVFQWIDESAHIPVKTAATDGSWSTEFKNIKTGPQDPALFVIPDGYTKMPFGMPDIKR